MEANSDVFIAEALATYWRLRHRGQTPLLARLSVEGQFYSLTVQQRREFHRLLNGGAEVYDAPQAVSDSQEASGFSPLN